jgi:hypothetical protein
MSILQLDNGSLLNAPLGMKVVGDVNDLAAAFNQKYNISITASELQALAALYYALDFALIDQPNKTESVLALLDAGVPEGGDLTPAKGLLDALTAANVTALAREFHKIYPVEVSGTGQQATDAQIEAKLLEKAQMVATDRSEPLFVVAESPLATTSQGSGPTGTANTGSAQNSVTTTPAKDDAKPEEKKTGMSTGTKVFLGVLGVAAVAAGVVAVSKSMKKGRRSEDDMLLGPSYSDYESF